MHNILPQWMNTPTISTEFIGCSTNHFCGIFQCHFLEVMLLRAEGDIQLLQTKMEELQSARITQAKGGADRIQMLGK